MYESPIAAQPSPGGQGDAVTTRRFIADRTPNPEHRQDVLDGCYDSTEWFGHVQAALAARQPVYVQGCDELRARTEGERAAYMEGLKEGKKIAARQTVEFERAIPTRRRESAVELLLQLGFVWNNQRWEDRRQPVGEPVAVIENGAFGGGGLLWIGPMPPIGTKLYTAQLAQAVGSDAVRERDLLASAIIDAAVKSGIYRDGVLMSGPQLLMACDDMAECIKSAQTGDLSAVREAVRKAWQKCAAGESIDTQFGTLLDLIDSTR